MSVLWLPSADFTYPEAAKNSNNDHLVVKSPKSEFFKMSGSMSTVIGLLNVRVEGSLVFRKCFKVV